MSQSHKSRRSRPRRNDLGGHANPPRPIVPYGIDLDGPPVGWLRQQPAPLIEPLRLLVDMGIAVGRDRVMAQTGIDLGPPHRIEDDDGETP